MRTFSVYRPAPPVGYVEGGFAVAVEKPQFQGVVFDDGTVAIRWFTLNGSTAIWPSLEDLEQIHGHPEYGTRWVWDDEPETGALLAQRDAELEALRELGKNVIDAQDAAMQHPITESKVRVSMNAVAALRAALSDNPESPALTDKE